LLQALRCNTQTFLNCVLQRRACNKFKRNYLENYNDSEHVVKAKNAPFFMIFPKFFHMVVNYWTVSKVIRLGTR
jgi:hypothetical protein